jgi:hypothetical protein
MPLPIVVPIVWGGGTLIQWGAVAALMAAGWGKVLDQLLDEKGSSLLLAHDTEGLLMGEPLSTTGYCN